MLQNILIALILTGSAWAMHLEYLNVDIAEDELHENLDVLARSHGSLNKTDLLTLEALFPGSCWACKWVVTTLKRQLGSKANADTIKIGLSQICNQIGLLKSVCLQLVSQYTDVLIEELSTTDGPGTVCANIGIC
ncbi:antimicrobial peptide NK-lysin-like [Brachyhypopomus gauderio]|uniref:antimicrobial peptide NK-lysin-like n=1 Tax=Brachyhypopomus gauderio TaxID=698409 RepID=UPI004042307D